MNKLLPSVKSLITLAALLCFLFQASAASAQKVSLSVRNATVKAAIERLQKDYGYSFVIKTKDADVNKKITLDVKNEEIGAVVGKMFAGQNVVSSVEGKMIAIMSAPAKRDAAARASANAVVKGVVKDSAGNPITGLRKSAAAHQPGQVGVLGGMPEDGQRSAAAQDGGRLPPPRKLLGLPRGGLLRRRWQRLIRRLRLRLLRGKERAVIFTLHEGADLQNRIVRQRAVLRDLEQLRVKLAPLYMHQLVRLDGADEAILRVDQIRPVGALLPCTLRAELRVCQRLLEVQPCSDPDRQSVGRFAVDLRQKIKVGKPIRCVRKHLVAADHGEILLAHAQIRAAYQLGKQNDLLRELGQIQYALHHRFPIQIVITAELCVDPDDHTAFLCLFLRMPGQDQTYSVASDVQCSLIGVISASFGQFNTLYTI